MSKTVAACFQASDRFLERFLVGLSDTHDFTNCTHLGTEFIFYAFEFFKSPAGKFDYYIVTVRHVFIQCAIFSARNIF